MLLMTAQGSRYIVTSDGMVLRHKSYHANTGGEDAGMQDWSQHIEFYDPQHKVGGTDFAQAVAKAIEKRLPVTLSNTNSGMRALLIHKDGNWRVAKISDIFKHVASTDDLIVTPYSTTPKKNWNPMDYDVNSNGVLRRVHPGNPVTHGMSL